MKKQAKLIVSLFVISCLGLYLLTGLNHDSINNMLVTDSSSDSVVIRVSDKDEVDLISKESIGNNAVAKGSEISEDGSLVENMRSSSEYTNNTENNEKISATPNPTATTISTTSKTTTSTSNPTAKPTTAPASCGAVGHTADGTCTVCGKVKDSNCDHIRVTNYVCRLCGADVCMSKGHTEIGVCPVCDSVKHSSQGHTEKGVCDACGSTITFVEGATEHYHGDGTDNGVCPVCGLSYSPMIDTSKPSGADDVSHVFEYHFNPAYTSCPACGLTWCPTCQSLDHTVHPTPAPTCGAVGHSTDGTCGVCGSVYTTPTCGAIGHSSDGVCSVCGSSYTTQIVSHYHGNGSDNGVCPACGLSYSPSIDISNPSGADDLSDIFG